MDYIDDIVTEMLNGSFSVFCGAGATCDATKKEWQDIFSNKTKEFYKEFSSDIYFLADLEKRYYNTKCFFSDICENLDQVSNKESIHINNIINLNLNQIWTTNFDSIIENTIERKFGFSPTIIKESADLFKENLHSKYLVYKLNGSVTKPETMVLTKSDFFNYFKKQRLIFEMLKRQLVLDSFLFVGYSFTDDLVLNALREIKDVFPNQGKKHYRFSVRNNKDPLKNEYCDLETRYYKDEYNIETIFVDSFSDIDIYLEKVYKRFCDKNVFIAGSFRQLKDNNERLYIEELVHSIIIGLTSNEFNVYSGNGRGLGEIVVAQINKCDAEKNFVNRPLIFTNDTDEQKRNKNDVIMKDCDSMIVICGQDDTLNASKNVTNQFFDFLNNPKRKFPVLIPIPSTGYAAHDIFYSQEFRKSKFYKLNKNAFGDLEKTKDIEEITQIVLNLIKSYKWANS